MAPESHIAVFWGTAHAGSVDRSNWSTSMVGEFRLRSPPRRGPEEHAQERTPWRPSSNSRSSPEPERALRSSYGLAEAPVPWTRHGDRRRSSGSRANLGVRSTSRSRRPLTRAAGPRGMWGRKVRYCAYLAGNGGMTLSPGGRDAGLESGSGGCAGGVAPARGRAAPGTRGHQCPNSGGIRRVGSRVARPTLSYRARGSAWLPK
jgi:hypothetical protein